MSDPVSFSMDNKNCVGKKAATIEDQALVFYRDRYYVVLGGVALAKGGKPVRYSLTSLPVAWKRALKGEEQLPAAKPVERDAATDPIPLKRERKRAEKPAMTEHVQEATADESSLTANPKIKPPKKSETKVAAQPPVVAQCPYCNTRHEIPVEKGKSGKPFFIPCSKCHSDFAVRFVQVTLYQAQVAGFR